MKRILVKKIIIFLIFSALFLNNVGQCVSALETDKLMAVSESVYTPDDVQNPEEDGNAYILTLAVITKNDKLRIVGESSETRISITIKDSSFVIVKQAVTNVTNGRFEWSDSLTKYTPEETYKVTITDNKGNTTSAVVTIPEKEDNYLLNLAVMTSDGYLTVAGESSSPKVNISIKNAGFEEVEKNTISVSNGRFEWRDKISKFKSEAIYRITVTDTEGHTASETATIPAVNDIYTLTVFASTKDNELKIVGESSTKSVKINIKDSNLSDLGNSSAIVEKGRFIWSRLLKDYKEDETYKIIITDSDGHTATEQVTIPISVKSIEFGDYEKKLEVGKSLSVTTTVLPSGAQNQLVKYTSSNDNIATVSSSGKVTGHSAGKVTITASCGSASVDAELTVYIKTIKIELNENYLTMLPNKTFQISAEVFPKTAEQKCTYTSTDDSVIVVTSDGKITAKNSGVASVIVSNGDTDGIITVVVNSGTDEVRGSLLNNSSYKAEKVHIENSQLASIIHNKNSKEIVLGNTDLKLVDPAALCMLKDENKNLIVEKGTYLIIIKGRAIANPANTLSVDMPIERVKDNIKFVVNDGQQLPGQIIIHLSDKDILTKKYLYLYNHIKNKYEEIDSFNMDDKSIYVDKGGTYLLTEKKLSNFPINWIVVAVIGCVCVVLGLIYVLNKRKYWFY